VGLRSLLYRLVDRGISVTSDDDRVELGVLSEFDGPLLLQRLIDAGIDAQSSVADPDTSSLARRITVPRREYDRAASMWNGGPER
jgi:hypothetical protein